MWDNENTFQSIFLVLKGSHRSSFVSITKTCLTVIFKGLSMCRWDAMGCDIHVIIYLLTTTATTNHDQWNAAI